MFGKTISLNQKLSEWWNGKIKPSMYVGGYIDYLKEQNFERQRAEIRRIIMEQQKMLTDPKPSAPEAALVEAKRKVMEAPEVPEEKEEEEVSEEESPEEEASQIEQRQIDEMPTVPGSVPVTQQRVALVVC